MKKYTIITTYPEHKSNNIGDWLITKSTIECIKAVKGEDIDFNIIWREANWEDIKDSINNSDAIIIATLALAGKSIFNTYPFIKNIISLNKPIGVISASTPLKSNNQDSGLKNEWFGNLNEETKFILEQLNDKSLFFTTRAYLTQEFYHRNKLKNVYFSGDIAFYNKRFENRVFEKKTEIKQIAVSDPHMPYTFGNSFKKLVFHLKEMFPSAEITILLHSKSPKIEELCTKNDFNYKKIFEDKENGLDQYENFDLHVGYRIHGHVSALSRRIPSYLIEQDGRGADYGLTFDKNISIPGFPIKTRIRYNFKNIVRLILNKKLSYKTRDNLEAIDKLVAIIRQDSLKGFSKFIGYEQQILLFNIICEKAFFKLP